MILIYILKDRLYNNISYNINMKNNRGIIKNLWGGGGAFYKQFKKVVNLNNTIHCKNQKFIKSQINNILAFSLIELSIVLIIIGLLVAGVTGGQSLIESAKQRSFITELRNWDVAVNTFYAAKGRLPGDTNNDGKFGQYVDDNYNGYFPAPYDGTKYSIPNYFTAPFVDLYLNEIIDFKPEYTSGSQYEGLPTSNALKSKSIYYFVSLANRINYFTYLKNIKDNILLLSFGYSNARYNTSFASGVDNKIDDNNPHGGKFRVHLVLPDKDNIDAPAENNYNLLDKNYEILYIGYDIIH